MALAIPLSPEGKKPPFGRQGVAPRPHMRRLRRGHGHHFRRGGGHGGAPASGSGILSRDGPARIPRHFSGSVPGGIPGRVPGRGRGPGEASQAHFWDAKGAVEIIVAAAGAGGELGWEPCTNRSDLHPKASASVTIAGRVLGHAGRIHPDAAREAAVPAETTLFELDRGALLDRASGRVTARPLARFPAVVRDLSLIVGEDTLAGQVYAAVVEFGEELVEGVLCFDEYSGEGVEEGSKALAFSITYRAADRTLTDDEVAGTHQRLVSHISDTLGVRARA